MKVSNYHFSCYYADAGQFYRDRKKYFLRLLIAIFVPYFFSFAFVIGLWLSFTISFRNERKLYKIAWYWNQHFCTGIHIVVLVYIFYCTGRYTRTANEDVCVLRYRMQQYNRYLCIAVVGHCKHVPSQMRRQLQELAKDFTSHGKQFSLLCSCRDHGKPSGCFPELHITVYSYHSQL